MDHGLIDYEVEILDVGFMIVSLLSSFASFLPRFVLIFLSNFSVFFLYFSHNFFSILIPYSRYFHCNYLHCIKKYINSSIWKSHKTKKLIR